jgi:hypothetical protein
VVGSDDLVHVLRSIVQVLPALGAFGSLSLLAVLVAPVGRVTLHVHQTVRDLADASWLLTVSWTSMGRIHLVLCRGFIVLLCG